MWRRRLITASLDRAGNKRLDFVERLLDRSIGTNDEVVSSRHLVERFEALHLRPGDVPSGVRALLRHPFAKRRAFPQHRLGGPALTEENANATPSERIGQRSAPFPLAKGCIDH